MSAVQFSYFGDNIDAVHRLTEDYRNAATTVDQLRSTWELSASTLAQPGTWSGTAQEAAVADVSKISTVLTDVGTRLAKMDDPLSTYWAALVIAESTVDSLNEQYEREIALQELNSQELNSAVKDPTFAVDAARSEQLRAEYQAALNASNVRISDLKADYALALERHNTSAAACRDALIAAVALFGPAGQPSSGGGLTAEFGFTNFAMTEYVDTVADAQETAALATQINDFNPDQYSSPEFLSLLEQYNSKLAENAADPVFQNEFYSTLGPDGTVKLAGIIGGVPESTGYSGEVGVPPELAGSIQELMGHGLAAVTDPDSPAYIETTAPGVDDFSTRLLAAAEQTIPVQDEVGRPWEVPGIVPLGALLYSGQYSPEFLALYEAAVQRMESPEAGGEYVWASGPPITWNHTDSGVDGFPRGRDPMNGLTAALGNNPDAAVEFLESNDSAREYLLSGRTWQTNDSEFGGPFYGEGEPLAGLTEFGSTIGAVAVATTATHPAGDPLLAQQQELAAKITDFYGSRSSGSGDLIPPELRPGLGVMSAANINLYQSVLGLQSIENIAGQHVTQAELDKYFSELAKSEAARTVLLTAENAQLAATPWQDLSSDAREAAAAAAGHLAGLITVQENVMNTEAQQAADDSNNAVVNAVFGSLEVVVDGGAAAGAAAVTASTGGSGIVTAGAFASGATAVNAGLQGVASWFLNDTSNEAAAENALNSELDQQSVVRAVASAYYSGVLEANDATAAAPVDANGTVIPWGELSDEQRDHLSDTYPELLGLDTAADNAGNTFEAQ